MIFYNECYTLQRKYQVYGKDEKRILLFFSKNALFLNGNSLNSSSDDLSKLLTIYVHAKYS